MAVFDSAVRSQGDLAGVFEYDDADGPTAYFYLCRIEDGVTGPIEGAIHVRSGLWNITEPDIGVMWDQTERRVGLFVHGVLCAAFDTVTGTKHGGGYGKDFHADIPWT